MDLHTDQKSKIYIDAHVWFKSEPNGLYAPSDGLVGDIINGQIEIPSDGITIFRSLGV